MKYVCEVCHKTFSQKGHLADHRNRKLPCKKDNTVDALVEKKVREVLLKIEEEGLIHKLPDITHPITMDYSKMTRNELIALCKEKGMKGYSGKKKVDLVAIVSSTSYDKSNKKQDLVVSPILHADTHFMPEHPPIHVDYTKKTVDELFAICRDKGIKGYSGKKKDAIVKLISDVHLTNESSTAVEQQRTIPSSEISSKIRVASLFAGCGGLDYGFHTNQRYSHVYVNDFNGDACKTYEMNFNITPVCGDIKQVETIPDCDILIGGFPCQGFSMANPYRDENDQRNELYLEILRLLRLKQPKYFLLENVKGLLNMGGYENSDDKKNQMGKVVKVILNDLTQCGYHVKLKLFDIKDYDVPQKRQRVIISGVRNDIIFDVKWPEPSKKIITLKDAIGDLPIEYNPAIQHIGTKHKCAVTGYLGNRELNWDEPSPTITGGGGGTGGPVIHNHPSLKRRLTVRECARIQTFPDSFRFAGSISSMYKQLGNAVPCKFSEYLAKIFEEAP